MLAISGTTFSLGISPGGSAALSLPPVQRLLASASATTDPSLQLNAIARDSFQLSVRNLLSEATARDALGRQLGETSGRLAAALDEPVAASGGERLRISGRREASVSIQTQDGDIVEISLRSATSVSAGSTVAVAGDTGASETTLNGSRERTLQIHVNGSLDADERKAIRKLLHRIDKAARKFFSGDLAKALHKLDKLKLKGDELASVAVNLSRQRTIDYAAALQLGASGRAGGEPAQPGTTVPKPVVPTTEFRRAPRAGFAPAATPEAIPDTATRAAPRARVFVARPASPPDPSAPAAAPANDTAAAPVGDDATKPPGAVAPHLSATEQIDLAGALRSFSGTLRIAAAELPGFAAVTVVTELSLLLLSSQAPAENDSDPSAAADEGHAGTIGFGRELIEQLIDLAESVSGSGKAQDSEERSGSAAQATADGLAADDDAERRTESTTDGD